MQGYAYLLYSDKFYDWKMQYVSRIFYYANGGFYSNYRIFSNDFKMGIGTAIILTLSIFLWVTAYYAMPIKGGQRYNSFILYFKK